MPGEEKSPVKLSLPLEFQQDIFHELRKEDELLILARGLGLLRIVTNLLHAYDAAGNNLIVIVGADDRENGWIGESLAEHAVVSLASKARGLSLVNTQMTNVVARQKLYAHGGIVSVTPWILILDLLSGVLEIASITGMIVLHAERVVATSIEAFILRIYRQGNKEGFLKAFSDNPEPFTRGFSPLSTMMRNLFLRAPSLYPRFQVDVAKSLEGRRKAEVIELEVPISESMSAIQAAIMECVEASVKELKKGNSGLDMEDWNLDNALHQNFDDVVMRQLRPVWHRLNWRTKQIAGDLRILRNMLEYLLTYDAVNFNQYLDTVLASSQPRPGSTHQNQSPWLFLDAADTIFETAKRRVYAGKLLETAPQNNNQGADTLRPVLEELPKWAVLAEILEEIERDAYFNPVHDDSSGAILIMCGDHGTCAQLREYLQTMRVGSEKMDDEDMEESQASASFMMKRKLRNYIKWKRDFAKISASLANEGQKASDVQADPRGQATRGRAPPNKRRRVRGASSAASGPSRSDTSLVAGDRDAHFASLLAELQPNEMEALQKDEIGADSLKDMDKYYELYEMSGLVVIHPYDGDIDEHVLEEVKPRYVVMYEPDAAFIRRVEVYRSSHTDRNVRTYFMYYKDSVEEQRYLSSVRKEKDAFTRLIRERANMTITLDNPKLDPEESFLRTVNTRIAGGGRISATTTKPRVVVDVREFRSSLPSLLHGRGMEIVPCMLTVGDYVLSPSICVERKSISDLIQSLASGRLYSQAETMMENYRSPMLLIEFEQTRSFTLEPFADLSASTGSSALAATPDLQSKIVLLTLAFPRLRIIWSSSPYQTAEIFEELKKNDEEPDPVKAVHIGLGEGEDPETGRAFNQTSVDMLREVPGVTEKNIARLSYEAKSIQELANMGEDEVCELVGREAGRKIWKFFNRDLTDD